MKGLLLSVCIVLLNLSVSSAHASLFFSEYIEGTSNNKALEIFNPGSNSVDFSAGNFTLQFFFNGSSSAGSTLNLAGTLGSGDVWVVADEDFDPGYVSLIDQVFGGTWFNGDDGIGLYQDGVLLDFIGQLGNDPGSQWGSGLVSTQDNTLRRLSSTLIGDLDPTDFFAPADSWQGFATDTFNDLGRYDWDFASRDVFSVPEPASSWLLLLGLILVSSMTWLRRRQVSNGSFMP